MSFGVKTNERPGTRAQVKYVRSSAYKAREVLDLVRGEPVDRALEILEFSERDIARVVLKCLESAIANAEANDGIPADQLEVAACFADEGPTLKRWRPRARGRATRIRKRTCHITVIVGRIDPDRLAVLRQRETSPTSSGGRAAEARRQRVLRSRQAKAERRAERRARSRPRPRRRSGHRPGGRPTRPSRPPTRSRSPTRPKPTETDTDESTASSETADEAERLDDEVDEDVADATDTADGDADGEDS